MTAPVFAPARLPLAWRWLGGLVWRLEHAFERARAAAAPQDSRLRIAFVMAVFALAFGVMAVGATHQALYANGKGDGAGSPSAIAARSDLVDRNGAMLAVDLPHYALYIDPKEVWDLDGTRQALTALLPEVPAKRLEKILTGAKRTFVAGGLTPERRDRLHDLGLPGFSFEDDQRRVYPLGHTASHIIGFTDSAGAGLAGAERALDKIEHMGAATGTPTALSIDLRVQSVVEEELRGAIAKFGALNGIGLVTDVHTGEIIALASYPDYDPNDPGKADPAAMMNRAAASVFEMGSTFKVFTVADGLDSGTVSLNSTFDVSHPLTIGSQTIHDDEKGDTTLDLSHVLLHSSNIGAAKIALATGADTVTKYYRNLGLLGPAKVELAESTRPLLPQKWNDNALASSAFGNAIAVSPLAIAGGMGTVLNGGQYVPLTIRKVEPGKGVQGKRVYAPQTSQTMLTMLRANVVEGTGKKADAPGYRVGGKTGSNEKVIGGRIDRNRLLTSFAGVFPTDGPLDGKRYFVLIMLDEPHGIPETYGLKQGAWNSAPTVGKIVSRIGPLLGVKRDLVAGPITVADKSVPAGQ